jgi:hypothetical protein
MHTSLWKYFVNVVVTAACFDHSCGNPQRSTLRRINTAISGIRRDVEIRTLLGYYAASNGNPLPTFRDNVSVPSSRVKKSKLSLLLLLLLLLVLSTTTAAAVTATTLGLLDP